MKKVLAITVILYLCFVSSCFADDDFSSGVEGLFNSTSTFDNAFAGQKQITDEEFQKTLAQVKEKQNRKMNKKRVFNASDFKNRAGDEDVSDISDKKTILTVPLELINGDGADISIGHYEISGKKINKDVYLDFYQSSNLIARVPAIETNDDFNQSGINFVQLLPYNEQRVKIIYGSMDFNAYTFLKIKNVTSCGY